MTDIDETKIRRLDFTLLLVFRALIRHRRTTVAAEELGLSQSAVSHALSRLRDLFEEPLFLRRPDGLQPTRGALALAPKVEALLALAGETVEGARRFDPATSERVFRIAANDFVTAMLAPLLAGALERQAPGIRFALGFAIGPRALEALRTDAVDLAIGRFASVPDGYVSEWLGDEGYLVAGRKAHPALQRGLDLGTYLALGHVLVSFQGGIRGTADQALAKLGENRRVATSVPTFLTALGVAATSDHLVTVPARLGQRYAADFGLALHAVPFAIEPFAVLAVRHARAAGDEGLGWLAARIKALWGPPEAAAPTRH